MKTNFILKEIIAFYHKKNKEREEKNKNKIYHTIKIYIR